MAPGEEGQERSSPSYHLWAFALIASGVLLQAWLAARAGIGGDQYVLFDLGLDYVEGGDLAAIGKGMSGGGSIPGSLLQLLIGVPFSLWRDYRAPVFLIGLFHFAAALVTLPVLRQAAGEKAALIFLALWWLSPWRLYHSGILWEPAYVVFPSALHLWACWRLRERPDPLASAVLAALLVLTFQLHGSFLFLVILTAILLVRRQIRIRPAAAFAGAVAGSLTLLPTAAALLGGTLPQAAPTKSFIGYGLVTVVPLLRGFLYWFRLGSLDVGRRLSSVVMLDADYGGGEPFGLVIRGGTLLLVFAAAASIMVAVAANWWFFLSVTKKGGHDPGWGWLRSYSLAGFLSLILSSALSPVTIQSWHVLIALPSASLPVALWVSECWPPRRKWLLLVLAAFFILRIPEVIVIGRGNRAYRLDADIASKLQERQKTLLPREYRIDKK